jgi:hypothetical protein
MAFDTRVIAASDLALLQTLTPVHRKIRKDAGTKSSAKVYATFTILRLLYTVFGILSHSVSRTASKIGIEFRTRNIHGPLAAAPVPLNFDPARQRPHTCARAPHRCIHKCYTKFRRDICLDVHRGTRSETVFGVGTRHVLLEQAAYARTSLRSTNVCSMKPNMAMLSCQRTRSFA